MKQKFIEIRDLLLGKEMGILPAGIAFSFFLALIPIITIIFFLLTSLDLSMEAIDSFIKETFSSEVVNLLRPILADKITVKSAVTLIIGLFVASSGANSIIIACNTIFDVPNASYTKRMIKSLMLSIIMIILFSFVICVPLLGNVIISLFGTYGEFIKDNEFLIRVMFTAIQIPISLLVVFFFIKLFYTIAPDQKVPSKYVTKGAIFTTIGWVVATGIYSYYINNVANYSLIYGNLANIVILLLWLYLLSYIFLIGIILNKNTVEAGVEKTNTLKLDEIRKKIKKSTKK